MGPTHSISPTDFIDPNKSPLLPTRLRALPSQPLVEAGINWNRLVACRLIGIFLFMGAWAEIRWTSNPKAFACGCLLAMRHRFQLEAPSYSLFSNFLCSKTLERLAS